MYDRFNSLGDYKRNFKIHLMMQRNDARYDKQEIYDSLEEVKQEYSILKIELDLDMK